MLEKLLIAVAVYLFVINVVTFILYGADKRKAKLHQWRIPEATLIGFAWIGGALGALAGMKVWHHKTQKVKFRIFIPLAVVVWIFAICLMGSKVF